MSGYNVAAHIVRSSRWEDQVWSELPRHGPRATEQLERHLGVARADGEPVEIALALYRAALDVLTDELDGDL